MRVCGPPYHTTYASRQRNDSANGSANSFFVLLGSLAALQANPKEGPCVYVCPPAPCTCLRRPVGSTIAIAPSDDVHDIFSVPPISALAIRVGAQTFK